MIESNLKEGRQDIPPNGGLDNLKFGIADHPHEESYSKDHPFNNDGKTVLSTDEIE